MLRLKFFRYYLQVDLCCFFSEFCWNYIGPTLFCDDSGAVLIFLYVFFVGCFEMQRGGLNRSHDCCEAGNFCQLAVTDVRNIFP